MESVLPVLVLLVAVAISGTITRALPLPIPLPLVQIALGATISASFDFGIILQPEIFMLLFLPPLLFLDGWRIPKDGLFHDARTILALAFGLVVFTVVGLGFFLNWLIPSMPLAVAFALAAVVSPTDPVAVSAIASRTPIPTRLMHILEGESLLNDASGLVCMRFAVVAAATGTFSLADAFGSLVWMSAGGLAVGIVLTYAITRAKRFTSLRYGEETGSQILISLLTPFGAYLLAEHLGCSGILAAVGAGISMSYVEQWGQALAMTRVRRASFWDTVQFAANGMTFVILGEQLPRIVDGAAGVVRDTGHHQPAWLAIYILAMTVGLVLLRFVWTWTALRFTMFRAARRGHSVSAPNWRLVVATALAGVRGSITLAGVMSLPLLLPNGSPFPARDLAIFLAAGVIILSLVIASIGLPTVLSGLHLPPEPTHRKEEDRARLAAAQAGMKAVETAQYRLSGKSADEADVYADAAAHIMDVYRLRLQRGTSTGEDAEAMRRMEAIERDLRLAGIEAERNTFYHLTRTHRLPEDIMRKLVRELDLLETRLRGG
ncbi:Na+/H+ antiporter [Aureimonas altamirensis]|uniref:Na+/H+ antiporter n=1 Tax=Aureimonas altamirensis TaxID=370622 RepID=UPI001E355693|nr:Na+/H+ antiporter [Aureimonas altamirensis]UHD47423.1 Na+/H+ antiporter [Aureimonas altamirensis]